MQAVFLAAILAVGADQGVFRAQPTVMPAPAAVMSGEPTPPFEAEHATALNVPAPPYRYDPPRDPKEDDGLVREFFQYCRAWFQPMPQTCYSPHFGCYPGNGRDIYRYPAFHGYYYRQAYNYRPLFEYPWQACLHEPLPLELPAERTPVSGPHLPQPPHAEVIETPAPTSSHPIP